MDTDRVSLEDLASHYGTLKVQHGFMPIYEKMLTDVKSLLEIGVHEGASLKTWRDYFPNAQITGIDKHLVCRVDGVTLIEADASLPFECENYDVIIDDGSHIAHEQLGAFRNLWEKVNPGGWYVVEDLFALYDKDWNPTGPTIIDHVYGRMQNILTGGDSIQEVHFFGRNDINGILFLRKRKEPFRVQPLSEFQMNSNS